MTIVTIRDPKTGAIRRQVDTKTNTFLSTGTSRPPTDNTTTQTTTSRTSRPMTQQRVDLDFSGRQETRVTTTNGKTTTTIIDRDTGESRTVQGTVTPLEESRIRSRIRQEATPTTAGEATQRIQEELSKESETKSLRPRIVEESTGRVVDQGQFELDKDFERRKADVRRSERIQNQRKAEEQRRLQQEIKKDTKFDEEAFIRQTVTQTVIGARAEKERTIKESPTKRQEEILTNIGEVVFTPSRQLGTFLVGGGNLLEEQARKLERERQEDIREREDQSNFFREFRITSRGIGATAAFTSSDILKGIGTLAQKPLTTTTQLITGPVLLATDTQTQTQLQTQAINLGQQLQTGQARGLATGTTTAATLFTPQQAINLGQRLQRTRVVTSPQRVEIRQTSPSEFTTIATTKETVEKGLFRLRPQREIDTIIEGQFIQQRDIFKPTPTQTRLEQIGVRRIDQIQFRPQTQDISLVNPTSRTTTLDTPRQDFFNFIRREQPTRTRTPQEQAQIFTGQIKETQTIRELQSPASIPQRRERITPAEIRQTPRETQLRFNDRIIRFTQEQIDTPRFTETIQTRNLGLFRPIDALNIRREQPTIRVRAIENDKIIRETFIQRQLESPTQTPQIQFRPQTQDITTTLRTPQQDIETFKGFSLATRTPQQDIKFTQPQIVTTTGRFREDIETLQIGQRIRQLESPTQTPQIQFRPQTQTPFIDLSRMDSPSTFQTRRQPRQTQEQIFEQPQTLNQARFIDVGIARTMRTPQTQRTTIRNIAAFNTQLPAQEFVSLSSQIKTFQQPQIKEQAQTPIPKFDSPQTQLPAQDRGFLFKSLSDTSNINIQSNIQSNIFTPSSTTLRTPPTQPPKPRLFFDLDTKSSKKDKNENLLNKQDQRYISSLGGLLTDKKIKQTPTVLTGIELRGIKIK